MFQYKLSIFYSGISHTDTNTIAGWIINCKAVIDLKKSKISLEIPNFAKFAYFKKKQNRPKSMTNFANFA